MGIVVGFWLVCALCSALVASHHNRSALGWFCVGLLCGPCGLLVALFAPLGAAPSAVPAHDDGEERGTTRTQDEEAARSPLGRVEGYGTQALAALQKACRGLGDPAQLSTIAAHSVREVEDSRDKGKLIATFGITQEPGPYVYGGHRYDKLTDAVHYAQRQHAYSNPRK